MSVGRIRIPGQGVLSWDTDTDLWVGAHDSAIPDILPVIRSHLEAQIKEESRYESNSNSRPLHAVAEFLSGNVIEDIPGEPQRGASIESLSR